jgi:uncharacterized protein DUF6726
MRFIQPLCLLLATVLLTGCVLTKLVTVPMRLVGAVVSIVPVAGDAAHEVIDEGAETVDKIPI